MANSAKAPDQLADTTFLALELAQNLVDTAMKCAQLLTTGVFSSVGGGFWVDIFNQGMQSSIGWLSGAAPLATPAGGGYFSRQALPYSWYFFEVFCKVSPRAV